MFPHVAFLSEASSTDVAGVWFFSGMNFDMIVESFGSSEGFFAKMTLVSSIAAMDQSVLIENGAREECFVADVAFERSFSRVFFSRVIGQIGFYREPLVAILTSIGLNAHVESFVSPHVARLRVTFAANVADVGTQTAVTSFVCVKRICGWQ